MTKQSADQTHEAEGKRFDRDMRRGRDVPTQSQANGCGHRSDRGAHTPGPINLTHRCEYCAGGECEIWASGGWITAARCSNCGMEHSHLVGMVADPEETTEYAQ